MSTTTTIVTTDNGTFMITDCGPCYGTGRVKPYPNVTLACTECEGTGKLTTRIG